jgi:hypothetical protein
MNARDINTVNNCEAFMNAKNINIVNNSVSPDLRGIGGVIRHSIPIIGHPKTTLHDKHK